MAFLDRCKSDLTLYGMVHEEGTVSHCSLFSTGYNPFVHLQCEDRIHRLGQQRDCTITYFDSCHTIDESMCVLNSMKQQNSDFLLGDDERGKASSGQNNSNKDTAGGLKYQDLQGVVSELVKTIQSQRMQCAADPSRCFEPMPPAHGPLIRVIESFTSKSSPQKKKEVKDDHEVDSKPKALVKGENTTSKA